MAAILFLCSHIRPHVCNLAQFFHYYQLLSGEVLFFSKFKAPISAFSKFRRPGFTWFSLLISALFPFFRSFLLHSLYIIYFAYFFFIFTWFNLQWMLQREIPRTVSLYAPWKWRSGSGSYGRPSTIILLRNISAGVSEIALIPNFSGQQSRSLPPTGCGSLYLEARTCAWKDYALAIG